jgi:hypothetical protein
MQKIKNILIAAFSVFTFASSPVFAVDYFGYFAAAGGGGDYQAQVADHSNVVWIVNPQSPVDAVNALSTVVQAGKKAIVHLPVFQNGGSFNTNWAANWPAWVAALAPYQSTIVAYYPFDEPNNLSAVNTNTMVTAVRTAFPGKPVAVIYSKQFSATNVGYFDWVGIDCYSNGAFSCDGTNYTRAYGNMRAALRADQRTIVVPQAGLPKANDGCCIDALKSEAKRFHQMAFGDPKVIGIFPFIWQTFNDGHNSWYGLEHYAALKPVWQQVGLATIGNWALPAGVKPVFRFFNTTNAEHFFTADIAEGINAARTQNFTFESIGFNVYSAQTGGMTALSRCYTGWDHYISSTGCGASTNEGIYGYVQMSQVSGTIPLHRFFDPGYGRHLETTNYAEGNQAPFVYEGVLGYVPDAPLPSVGC